VRWQDAACEGADVDLFFPAPPRRGMEPDYGPALALCRMCAEVVPCAAYARDLRIVDGVWGGRTPEQREQERKARRAA
jgi:WhiB family transcriptional regulator, redox-sensing transcriptional regulator